MKSIQKSVRMTDEVYAVVSAQKGKGFNEQFEYLVLKYKYAEKKLNQSIADKQKVLDNLENQINDKRRLLQDLQRIEYSLKSLLHICDSISDK